MKFQIVKYIDMTLDIVLKSFEMYFRNHYKFDKSGDQTDSATRDELENYRSEFELHKLR